MYLKSYFYFDLIYMNNFCSQHKYILFFTFLKTHVSHVHFTSSNKTLFIKNNFGIFIFIKPNELIEHITSSSRDGSFRKRAEIEARLDSFKNRAELNRAKPMNELS
jgi:hypothetical protein